MQNDLDLDLFCQEIVKADLEALKRTPCPNAYLPSQHRHHVHDAAHPHTHALGPGHEHHHQHAARQGSGVAVLAQAGTGAGGEEEATEAEGKKQGEEGGGPERQGTLDVFGTIR